MLTCDAVDRLENKMILDAIGIGAGPTNLSVAALSKKVSELRVALIEQKPCVRWHDGMLLPEARLQVNMLKDLVTLVDPTSRYSFVSFLHTKGRLLQFINADFKRVMRAEFDQYLRWVAEELGCITYGQEVREVSYDGLFRIRTDDRSWRTRNIVLGVGKSPTIPEAFRSIRDASVFHSADYRENGHRCKGRRVCVVGGGQSGAEIVNNLLSENNVRPSAISWISRRSNFRPLEESCFTDEFYTPSFSRYFFVQNAERREVILRDLHLSSDGISTSLLRELYQKLYWLRHMGGEPMGVELLPGCEVRKVSRGSGAWQLECNGANAARANVVADIVVLAAGYGFAPPAFLQPIADRLIVEHGTIIVDKDYSAIWRVPTRGNIYALNTTSFQWGAADPNLSLLSWRSAAVVNSLAGRSVYRLREGDQLIDWQPQDAELEPRMVSA
jgi:lysine N6-hydroxylase